MGFYAGYALSLFGREQDRLSHVLVSAPFESSWEFFYPTPYPQVIATQGGRELADAATAQVRLAQIPFVRLRPVLPAAMRDDTAGFLAVVQAADRHLAPPRLLLDVPSRSIEADGQRIPLGRTIKVVRKLRRVGDAPMVELKFDEETGNDRTIQIPFDHAQNGTLLRALATNGNCM